MKSLFKRISKGASLSIGIGLSLTVQAEIIELGNTKSLSASSLLKAQDNSPISVIKIPKLLTKEGKQAKGNQTLVFSLDPNAHTSVNVMNTAVQPGGTATIKVSANVDGGLDIPIYSLSQGVVGTGMFKITIDEVKLLSCPSGWTETSNEMCYKYSYSQPTSYSCPSNYGTGGDRTEDSICYYNQGHVVDQSYSCKSGYTKNKWEVNYCADSKGYTESNTPENVEDCKSSGGKFWYDGIHYVCTFISPHSYRVPYTCKGTKIGNGCYDTSRTESTTPNCPSGSSWSSYDKRCSKINYTPMK